MLPRGGTELMIQCLLDYCGTEWEQWCNLHIVVPKNYIVDKSKCNILWCHLNHENDNVAGLTEPQIRNQFDYFVFVSEWQRQKFIHKFAIDPIKTKVIRNAIRPLDNHNKPTDKMVLIYTSMPWRGLDILLDAIDLIDRDFELHVYSSLKIYGSDYEANTSEQYAPLFQRAKTHPKVIYKGYAGNGHIRHSLQDAHIMAYPSIFEETSCLSIIEAAYSGCKIVSTMFGAIPETTNGFAELVPLSKNLVNIFAETLTNAIDTFWSTETQTTLQNQEKYFKENYDWHNRAAEWKQFFNEVKMHKAEQKRVMIATPTYDGKIDVWYVNSLVNTLNHPSAQNYFIRPVWVSYDSLIQRARNDLVWYAREGNYDEVIFIDADVEWEPEHFFNLLNYPVDVVGGTYPKKGEDEAYVIRQKSTTPNYNELGLLETDGLGAGFLRVSRKALDYLWDTSQPYTHNNKDQRWIFEVVIKNNDIHSEDIIMCEKLQQGGYQIWLDPTITCNHIGFKKYSGNFQNWYSKIPLQQQSTTQIVPSESQRRGNRLGR